MAKAIAFATVRDIGLKLTDVEEGTTYGSPALKVRGKLLACIAVNKSAEPNTLAVVVGVASREALIAERPDVYYVTDHYADYPTVLVRLSRIHKDELKDLLGEAWQFVTASARRSTRSRY